jgi:hypothetical protein
VTVAPPLSRLHLFPALLSAALLCVLLACPAAGKDHGDKKVPPGQAKKAKAVPPGQAKKAAGGQTNAASGGHASKAAKKQPPGQAKKSGGWQPPGQAKKAGGGQTTNAVSGGPAKKAAKANKHGRRGARARAAARRRAAAASRRTLARRRAAAAARRAGRAVTAGGGSATTGTTVATGAGATAGTTAAGKPKQRASKRPKRNVLPAPPRDQLPQPFRVVRDVVNVVPTPLRILVAGLVALAILLAGAAGLTLLRNRRLERQRRELLGRVGLLQAALLPEVPKRLGPSRASVAYRPAEGPAAGGDFYDVLSLAGGQTAVIIGDVSGHGRDALGRTALARYTLRAYVEAGIPPHEALQIAGAVLAGKLEGDFVTALIAVHDAAAGTLTYATAGHPPPIVISGAPFKPVLTAAAPPVGVGATTGQRQTTVPFPRGSIACFYTDGLSEARMGSGRLVGAAGLERIVRKLGPDVTAEQVIDGVAASARRIADDAAVCVITAEDGAAIVRSRLEWLELTRADLRGPMLRRFLDACGVSPHAVRGAERTAREIARESGAAIIEVRMGERSEVEVQRPDLPQRELRGVDVRL